MKGKIYNKFQFRDKIRINLNLYAKIIKETKNK